MTPDLILLGHGSGGKLSHQLLNDLIIPILSANSQNEQNDAAVLPAPPGRLAFTTDSFVVDPIFFSGGTIGDLAINGTVNDLSMVGARPFAVSVGLIIEEGLPFADLKRVLQSMRLAAEAAEVSIVVGDTKVVPRGKADKLFINTSGIGVLDHDYDIRGNLAEVGDKILINGTLGDHGMSVLACREGLNLDTTIQTDSIALNHLVQNLIAQCGHGIHVLRDPTRGGVATTLKEIAIQSEVQITLDETSLPMNPAVAAACSILGFDPLFVANEGKLLAFVKADCAEQALSVLAGSPGGHQAAIIGEVTAKGPGQVRLKTVLGGLRAVEMLAGDQLPRIC